MGYYRMGFEWQEDTAHHAEADRKEYSLGNPVVADSLVAVDQDTASEAVVSKADLEMHHRHCHQDKACLVVADKVMYQDKRDKRDMQEQATDSKLVDEDDNGDHERAGNARADYAQVNNAQADNADHSVHVLRMGYDCRDHKDHGNEYRNGHVRGRASGSVSQ